MELREQLHEAEAITIYEDVAELLAQFDDVPGQPRRRLNRAPMVNVEAARPTAKSRPRWQVALAVDGRQGPVAPPEGGREVRSPRTRRAYPW